MGKWIAIAGVLAVVGLAFSPIGLDRAEGARSIDIDATVYSLDVGVSGTCALSTRLQWSGTQFSRRAGAIVITVYRADGSVLRSEQRLIAPGESGGSLYLSYGLTDPGEYRSEAAFFHANRNGRATGQALRAFSHAPLTCN